MSDFSDRPFVAGSLTGTRSFRVDQYGRLTGVHHRTVWTPDENTAVCRAGSDEMAAIWRMAMASVLTTMPPPRKPGVDLTKKHRAGSRPCGCGYYAYFDDDANPYHGNGYGQIEGVIEGYGLTTVGTRGFRCEKAQVKALIVPGEPPAAVEAPKAWAHMTRRERRRHVVACSGSVHYGHDDDDTRYPALVKRCYLYPQASEPLSEALDLDAVRRNYPGIPFYSTQAAALADFPRTLPAPPTPESDPEFWTRAS